MQIDRDFWAGRRVLLSGHTGFKGAWLALWLQALGARVTGLAPAPPTQPSLYELARVGEGMRERAADVRDATALREAVAWERPEIVLHLAAQPLVRLGHREPVLTYEVNVMGTVNVLEAIRHAGEGVRAVVVVTSDKCYENPARRARVRARARQAGKNTSSSPPTPSAPERFVEDDPLGGEDPYSSSKACAELVAAAYRTSFFSADLPHTRVATARAGNVIGGGDWGADRLIPDVVRAVEAGRPVAVRNPDAVRPWQHVLNPLMGYLLLAQRLWSDPEAEGAWNFGPAPEDERAVGWVVRRLADLWGERLRWETAGEGGPPEAGHLALDSTKAHERLGWRPAWGLEGALERVVAWHEAQLRGEEMRVVTLAQIDELMALL
jgi:CDP-glucose 4,6-dehydratase